MRTFYIFNIRDEYASLTKNNPYNLFLTIYNMSKLKKDNMSVGVTMFNQISKEFDKNKLSDYLFKKYKNNYSYSNHLYEHVINDYYSNEMSKMIINSRYLVLQSSKDYPMFFDFLKRGKKNNLFVCDFKNRDYFWVEELK